ADRTIGIDVVAAVDEELRIAPAHRLVDLHAAEVRIDAPVLAGGVAAPNEANVAAALAAAEPVLVVVRQTAQHHAAAFDRRAQRALVREALEAGADEYLTTGRQVHEVLARDEVGVLERVGADHALHVAPIGIEAVLDDQPRRPIAAAPYHQGTVLRVTE